MNKIILEDQITSFEKITSKDIHFLSFKDIISLFFHAALKVNNSDWRQYYASFQNDLKEQNMVDFPKIYIGRNDYYKRMEVTVLSDDFIDSDNMFTYLLRLLYIENYKRPYIYSTYEYHKILNHIIVDTIVQPIEKLSMHNILVALKKYIEYYVSIYHSSSKIENILGKKILSELK